MNELLYSARSALKDVIECNILSRSGGKVYLTFEPQLHWEHTEGSGTGQSHDEKTILKIIDYLQDMNLDLAGGESAIAALLQREPVEIVKKAA